MRRFPLLALAALALPGVAQAGPAQASGRAEAVVVQALGGAALSGLEFAVPAAAAAVRASATRRARFVVTGEAGRAYAIISPSAVTVATANAARPDSNRPAANAAAPPSSLRVDRLDISSGQSRAGGMLGADGFATFEIGGRISVPDAKETAQYRGDIRVIVTYQ